MWTRCTLRVILNRECRAVFKSNTLDRIIIQVNMRNLDVWGLLDGFWINAKTMVLGCDFAFTSDYVFHRVV